MTVTVDSNRLAVAFEVHFVDSLTGRPVERVSAALTDPVHRARWQVTGHNGRIALTAWDRPALGGAVPTPVLEVTVTDPALRARIMNPDATVAPAGPVTQFAFVIAPARLVVELVDDTGSPATGATLTATDRGGAVRSLVESATQPGVYATTAEWALTTTLSVAGTALARTFHIDPFSSPVRLRALLA